MASQERSRPASCFLDLPTQLAWREFQRGGFLDQWICLDLCFCPDAWELVDENLRLARELLKEAAG